MLASSSFINKKSSGGIVGKTGSPSETTCATCHSGGNGISGVTISASPVFVAGTYVPGQTYTISIDVSNPNFSFFGFDAEILNTSNTNAGTMTTGFGGVQFGNFGLRKNATHSTPKTGSGSASFSFEWVAPVGGQVKIYAAGNAINGNASTTGDSPGSTSLILGDPLSVNETPKTVYGFNVYPNPIVSNFKINYSLSSPSEIVIAVCDLQGKECARLLSQKQNEGFHSVNAEMPENLTKGVYLLKLICGDKTTEQRLIILQ